MRLILKDILTAAFLIDKPIYRVSKASGRLSRCSCSGCGTFPEAGDFLLRRKTVYFIIFLT